ncbi:hypothetical protein, partial [Acidithiobacillus ferriphilus]|nr:hypothetical protein [Acidithiobacillus ferriphilus]
MAELLIIQRQYGHQHKKTEHARHVNETQTTHGPLFERAHGRAFGAAFAARGVSEEAITHHQFTQNQGRKEQEEVGDGVGE